MSLVPFSHRSIFDDIDAMFDDTLWDHGFGLTPYPTHRRHPTHHQQSTPRNWTATVQLRGFRPNEVKIDLAKDNSTVKVHAHRDTDGDYAEVKRTVIVPDNVDRERLEVDLTREGVLVVKAPYLHQPQQHGTLMPHRPNYFGPVLPHFNQELRALENDMWNLAHQSFPGSLQSHFVQGEDGTTRLNMDFNLSGYKPEEVAVTHDGDYVTVEAKHETKTENGSSYKHFKRMFTLPKNVDAENLSSRLLSDGRLRLEAPCKVNLPEQPALKEQEIPVKRSSK